ncbi:hypothetical protein [uncultured Aquitalea sp.]|uniref:hypothetical protein n=2 Tax=uncultured Aquitalea sp. TaxID=540272 RepID=UPI0025F6F99B|nr:hypothetical protein [uncultured Aquitalea sp.]
MVQRNMGAHAPGLGSGAVLAGDITQVARDIARDATDIARDSTDIHADRAALQMDLAAASALRVDRRVAEQALQAGDLATAQTQLAKVEALGSAIRQAEAKVAAAHRDLTLVRIDRALDKAELAHDARDLSGDAGVQPETGPAASSQVAADRAALETAMSA